MCPQIVVWPIQLNWTTPKISAKSKLYRKQKKKHPLHQHKPLENMSRFACNNATSKSVPNQPIVWTIQYDSLYHLVTTTIFTQKLIGKHAHSLLENVPS
jgi:hypothetical protein